MSPPPLPFDRHRVRWIAFDAVGTLLKVNLPVAEVYSRIARKYGSRLTERDIARRFPQVFAEIEREDGLNRDWTDPAHLTTSEDRERRRWRAIVAAVLNDVPERDLAFEELFAHFARPEAWTCYPDVRETLERCAAAGYRLAVASNFDARLHAVCDGLPALRPIELRVISSEVGYRKPSRHFYRALLAAAGCRPEELLMVGDDATNDVRGARAAGLPTLLLRRQGAATPGELADLGDLLNCRRA